MVRRSHQTLRQKRQAIRQWLLSTTFHFLLVAFVITGGIMYVVKTNSLSTTGYDISDLEQQIQVLEQANQKLEFEIASYQSMKSIQQRLPEVNLVAADRIEYVSLVGSAVARR